MEQIHQDFVDKWTIGHDCTVIGILYDDSERSKAYKGIIAFYRNVNGKLWIGTHMGSHHTRGILQ